MHQPLQQRRDARRLFQRGQFGPLPPVQQQPCRRQEGGGRHEICPDTDRHQHAEVADRRHRRCAVGAEGSHRRQGGEQQRGTHGADAHRQCALHPLPEVGAVSVQDVDGVIDAQRQHQDRRDEGVLREAEAEQFAGCEHPEQRHQVRRQRQHYVAEAAQRPVEQQPHHDEGEGEQRRERRLRRLLHRRVGRRQGVEFEPLACRSGAGEGVHRRAHREVGLLVVVRAALVHDDRDHRRWRNPTAFGESRRTEDPRAPGVADELPKHRLQHRLGRHRQATDIGRRSVEGETLRRQRTDDERAGREHRPAGVVEPRLHRGVGAQVRLQRRQLRQRFARQHVAVGGGGDRRDVRRQRELAVGGAARVALGGGGLVVLHRGGGIHPTQRH